MKTITYQKNFAKLMLALMATLFLVNCSNNNGGGGGGGTAVAPTAASYYQVVGNQCMLNANGALTVANPSYCQNSGTNTFYYSQGTNCYLRNSNGSFTSAAASYCSSGSTGTGYQTGVCTGAYTDDYQVVNCGTQMNCAGYTLRNYYTGQIHTCQ